MLFLFQIKIVFFSKKTDGQDHSGGHRNVDMLYNNNNNNFKAWFKISVVDTPEFFYICHEYNFVLDNSS